MTRQKARRIVNRVARKEKIKIKKEAMSIIRTIKADIKKTAKKGIRDFRVKVENADIHQIVKAYFKHKKFRCWEYTSENVGYLAIEW